MRRQSRMLAGVLGLALTLGGALGLWAGPMLPKESSMPDEVRCLAGLKTVSVEIDLLPAGMAASKDRLRLRIAEALKPRGFEIVDPPQTPRLALQLMVASSADLKDVVAVTAILAVHQRVRLYCVDEDMTLPVATVVTTGLGPDTELEKLVMAQTDAAVELLASSVEQASRRSAPVGAE